MELDHKGNIIKCFKKSMTEIQYLKFWTTFIHTQTSMTKHKPVWHQSFRFLGPKIWGLYLNEWKSIHSITTFKTKSKQFKFQRIANANFLNNISKASVIRFNALSWPSRFLDSSIRSRDSIFQYLHCDLRAIFTKKFLYLYLGAWNIII